MWPGPGSGVPVASSIVPLAPPQSLPESYAFEYCSSSSHLPPDIFHPIRNNRQYCSP
ncbi:hypothetical protein CBM2585_A10072 [Cupriavidus taiwanensis]|nr:hypothetical protein CBM2585_A10072 [Cupriavidus taiwanensis]